MNTGAWACGILACIFGILVIILSLLKEKGAMLVSGFNTLSKKQRNFSKMTETHLRKNGLLVKIQKKLVFLSFK